MNPLAGGLRLAAKRAIEMEGSGFHDGEVVMRRRLGKIGHGLHISLGLVGDFTGIQTLGKKLVARQWERTRWVWHGGKKGKKVHVEGGQNDGVLWVFFNFIFNFNNDILVTLHPKTTSFWVFHQFSWFQLTDGAIL